MKMTKTFAPYGHYCDEVSVPGPYQAHSRDQAQIHDRTRGHILDRSLCLDEDLGSGDGECHDGCGLDGGTGRHGDDGNAGQQAAGVVYLGHLLSHYSDLENEHHLSHQGRMESGLLHLVVLDCLLSTHPTVLLLT